MATYRVFTVGKDDHITSADILDCSNDREAMTMATEVAGDHQTAVEVWQLSRRVGRVARTSDDLPEPPMDTPA